MRTLLLFALIFYITEQIASLHSSNLAAQRTYYNSYPMCCPNSPTYDPNVPTEECDDYSGCEYIGDFAAFQTDENPDGHESLDYVQTRNLVAFFDSSDPTEAIIRIIMH